MSAIRPQDFILYAGGDSWQRFKAFTRKTQRIGRFGETQAEVFTRADSTTCASYLGRDGLYHLAAANVIRPHWLDTNGDGIPDTLTYLGEPARTNTLLQSQALATTWTTNLLTATNAAATGPDGLTSASLLVPTAVSSAAHRAIQNFTITANENFAFWIAVKVSGYNAVRLQIVDAGTNLNGFVLRFDASTGLYGTNAAAGTGTLAGTIPAVNLGNGWWALGGWGSAAGAITAMTCFIDVFDTIADANGNTAFTGNGTSGILAWNPQLERSGTSVSLPPSAPIKTTTGTVARAVDVCSVPVPGDVVPISLYIKFQERGGIQMASGGNRILIIGAVSVNPSFLFLQSGGKYQTRLLDPSGSLFGATAVAVPNYGDIVELVGTYDPVAGAITMTQAINGVAAGTVTTGSVTKFAGVWGSAVAGILNDAGTGATPGAVIRAMMVQGVHTLAECQAVP